MRSATGTPIFLILLTFVCMNCKCQLSNSWSNTTGTQATADQTNQAPPVVAIDIAPSEPFTAPKPVPNRSGRVRLEPVLAHPVLPAGKRQTTYLKIGLTAFELDEPELTPRNVAIVLDRSGSMAGEKLQQAKQAAVMAVRRLRPKDIVSVIAYDHNVGVLVSATPAKNLDSIIQGIERFDAGGSTALYDGVRTGAAEVRKYLDRRRINRVVLLSDGLANVGPSSVGALTELGRALIKEGIGVTTIGLGMGYNEDLMTELALHSEGNHAFVRTPADLRLAFDKEFGAGLAVVAMEATMKVQFPEGVRPLRILNSTVATMKGQTIKTHYNQLYSGHHAFLLVEVEVPAGTAGAAREIARTELSYANSKTNQADTVTALIRADYSDSMEDVQRSMRKDVMVAVAENEAMRRNMVAVKARDEGRYEEARAKFMESSSYLEKLGRSYGSGSLLNLARDDRDAANSVRSKSWEAKRKLYKHRNMKNFAEGNKPW